MLGHRWGLHLALLSAQKTLPELQYCFFFSSLERIIYLRLHIQSLHSQPFIQNVSNSFTFIAGTHGLPAIEHGSEGNGQRITVHPASQGVVLIRERTRGCGTDERPQFLSPPPASAPAQEAEGLTARQQSSCSLVPKSPRTDDLPGLALTSLAPIFRYKPPPGHEGSPPASCCAWSWCLRVSFGSLQAAFPAPPIAIFPHFSAQRVPKFPCPHDCAGTSFQTVPAKLLLVCFIFYRGNRASPHPPSPVPPWLPPTHRLH